MYPLLEMSRKVRTSEKAVEVPKPEVGSSTKDGAGIRTHLNTNVDTLAFTTRDNAVEGPPMTIFFALPRFNTAMTSSDFFIFSL